MQPMGRRPVRFPGKIDHHPPKGSVNWWEAELSTESKKTERANGKKEIAKAMTESDDALRVAREEIKRQAAEIERLRHWQRAVDDACAASWVPVTDDARKTVKALIARECQIAIDPLVSSDAQALIDRGRKDAEAEIERLKTRLEVSPDHDYDGIYCRDATIKLQDEHIAKLREQKPVNARLLAIVHQTVGMIENTSIETGYCCCGDGMDGHASPMICGHSATDQGAYLAGLLYEDAKSAIAAAEAQQAEPSCCPDKTASELEADAARYHYIRTHRIGIKWCELYAGGPALDGVIDEMMAPGTLGPFDSAALRARAEMEK